MAAHFEFGEIILLFYDFNFKNIIHRTAVNSSHEAGAFIGVYFFDTLDFDKGRTGIRARRKVECSFFVADNPGGEIKLNTPSKAP